MCELPLYEAWEVAGAALLTGAADDGAGVYAGAAEDAGTTEAAEEDTGTTGAAEEDTGTTGAAEEDTGTTEAAEEGTATEVNVTGLEWECLWLAHGPVVTSAAATDKDE